MWVKKVIYKIYLLLSIKSDIGMHLRPVPKTIRKDVRSTVTRRPKRKQKHLDYLLFPLQVSPMLRTVFLFNHTDIIF